MEHLRGERSRGAGRQVSGGLRARRHHDQRLTLASFIKFFGVSFLSRTSTLVAASAGKGKLEVGWLMQLPQLFLAAACILLGIVPAIAYSVMHMR